MNTGNEQSITIKANWKAIDFHAITYMQEMTPAICAVTTTPAKTATGTDTTGEYHGNTNYVPQVVLKDNRDNNTYTVRKLADGNCWMISNLRAVGVTLSAAESDNLTSNFTLPASSDSWASDGITTARTYLDPIGGDAGVNYSWYAATAGTNRALTGAGTTSGSICPKGWELPRASGDKSMINMISTVYGVTNVTGMRSWPISIPATGHRIPTYTTTGGWGNNYSIQFTAGASNTTTPYVVIGASGRIDLQYAHEAAHVGFSVRCVAKGSTMQNFDKSMLADIDDSMQLEDERDGTIYTVKKLADGKVWMTENLRLANKTISSADSNLPSGETWTIPASSANGFSAYNTNNAYLDNTYGGYYTFYTATAGWGTTNNTTGNSPKDICPKGWRLPTGGSSGEFQTLYNNYGSSALMRNVPGLVLTGHLHYSYFYKRGEEGYYWSSTANGTNRAHRLHLEQTVDPTGDDLKDDGFAIRCIAK